MIIELVEAYQDLKSAIVPSNQDLRALVHIHAGLAIWLGAVIVWRKGFAAMPPLIAVIALCLLGEGADLISHWPIRYDWVWRDTAGDVFNTLLWPVLIWLYASWREHFRSSGKVVPDED